MIARVTRLPYGANPNAVEAQVSCFVYLAIKLILIKMKRLCIDYFLRVLFDVRVIFLPAQ